MSAGTGVTGPARPTPGATDGSACGKPRSHRPNIRMPELEAELHRLEQTDDAVKAAREALDDLPNRFARINRHEVTRRGVGRHRAN